MQSVDNKCGFLLSCGGSAGLNVQMRARPAWRGALGVYGCVQMTTPIKVLIAHVGIMDLIAWIKEKYTANQPIRDQYVL